MTTSDTKIKGKRAHTIIVDDPMSSVGWGTAQEILPEERAAVKAAKKVLREGPQRVIVNSKGEAQAPAAASIHIIKNIKYVFIRDDGWTIGCTRAHKDVAEEMWRGDWVGRMEFERRKAKIGKRQYLCDLHVYSQQGFEFKVGTMDPDGKFVTGPDRKVTEAEQAAGLRPRTLEEMREWMRKGCPDE